VAEPILYHGDEIEVAESGNIWAPKKVLRIIKHSGGFSWAGLSFLLELKVDNPSAPSFAGIFIDGAEEPVVEIAVSATEYELFERTINIGSWGIGSHTIEVKLKSEGTICNRLFEIYTILPLPLGSVVKTS